MVKEIRVNLSLFVIVSISVQQNLDSLKILIKNNFTLGIFLFILLEITSIVLAPVTSLPLLPLASNTYGVWLSSLFYIIGGIIGSIIAFFIGRKFRNKIIKYSWQRKEFV